MNGYIYKLIIKYGHSRPSKAQFSPQKHREVPYGAKEQLTPEEKKSAPLDKGGTKRTQGIVGSLLYYVRVVDDKLISGFSYIGSHQADTTECTNESINQLIDYISTYTANGILYRSSNMVLCAHSDAGFCN